MRYRNVKTGVVIDTPCVVEGEDWEVLDSCPPSKATKEKADEKPVKRVKK